MKFILLFFTILITETTSFAGPGKNENPVNPQLVQQALCLVENFSPPERNEHWPKVNTSLFKQNLLANIINPERIYQGMKTNLCGYAAVTYILIKHNPVSYVRWVLDLFEKGTTTVGAKLVEPGSAIRRMAGTITQKGKIDSAHADQVWFLSLADSFKGFLNIHNRKFQPGDESRSWASTNFSKFRRMAKLLTGNTVESIGSDITKPYVGNLPDYIQDRLDVGTVVLFANRRIKDKVYPGIKLWLPTHFVVVSEIIADAEYVTFKFWDYGAIKSKMMTREKFRKTVYGIYTIHRSSIPGKEDMAGL